MRVRHVRAATAAAALLAGSLGLFGCADTDDAPRFAAGTEPETVFATSLHATAQGMRTAWEAPDGIGAFTGIDYDTVGCKNCHEWGSYVPRPDRDTCESCHLDGKEEDSETCYSCHKRQYFTNKPTELAEPDVHRAAGMQCVACHKGGDLHGDPEVYASMLEEGAIDVKCEDCHENLSPTQAHTVHGDQIHCSACHTRTIVTCYNCHLDTMVGGGGSIAATKMRDWVFLMNDQSGKVRAANFQSVAYEAGGATANSFIAFAPYEAHTIMPVGRPCTACHGTTMNQAVAELVASDKITATWWDAATHSIKHREGVIPIVDGKMEFQHLAYNGSLPADEKWFPLTTTTWKTQYHYGYPLTAWQIQKMKQAQTGTD